MSSMRLRTFRGRIPRKKSKSCCPWWPLLSLTVLAMVCIWCIHKSWRSHLDALCIAEEEKQMDLELEYSYGHRKGKTEAPIVHVVQVVRPATWCELKQSFNVCLATQATVDRLSTIGQVAENWQGPISLAIFLNKKYELNTVRDFINHMRFCHYRFKTTVSVTIVLSNDLRTDLKGIWNRKQPLITLDGDEDEQLLLARNNKLECETDQFFTRLQKQIHLSSPNNLSNSNTWFPYPQNHLRNIARKHCETEWVFVTDADLIPKNNAASDLQTFYESEEAQSCKKCAFVIPAFGIVENCTHLPETKLELLEMVNASLAEPFHQLSWEPAQKQTNYYKWSTTNLEEEPVHISHKVIHNFTAHLVFHNRLNFYEPFYIAPTSIPEYDTRFVGYGFTRSSQTYESIVAGWTFHVLTPIYSLHLGMQGRRDWNVFRRTPRALQTRRNKPIYNLFSKTIWMKYRRLRPLQPPTGDLI